MRGDENEAIYVLTADIFRFSAEEDFKSGFDDSTRSHYQDEEQRR